MEKIVTYFKGVKSEWGKITWPDKKQVITQTIIVLVLVTLFTIYTFGIDVLFRDGVIPLIQKLINFALGR